MIFDEVDEIATAAKVSLFFKSDYPKFKRQASVSMLKVSNWDEKVSSSRGNTIEDRYTKKMLASQIIETINNAIKACDETSQVILEMKHLRNEPNWKIEQRLNYSPAWIDKLRIQACNQFADAFEVVAEPLLGNDSDLHVYK